MNININIKFICGLLLLIATYGDCLRDYRDPWKGLPMLCSKEDPRNVSISCHGVRIVKRVIQELLERAATTTRIQITDGISIVDNSIDDGHPVDRKGRTLKSTILGLFEGKELRIKLSSFMPFDLENFNSDEQGRRRNDGLGLGGGKKGNNNIFIMALLMGKMLGIIGFGTLGFLTMKALMASSLALMLSIILAAKKFSSSSQPSENHIVYAAPAPAEPHRRKRQIEDIDLSPYRGWLKSYSKEKSLSH